MLDRARQAIRRYADAEGIDVTDPVERVFAATLALIILTLIGALAALAVTAVWWAVSSYGLLGVVAVAAVIATPIVVIRFFMSALTEGTPRRD
jgi:hypothetical protein